MSRLVHGKVQQPQSPPQPCRNRLSQSEASPTQSHLHVLRSINDKRHSTTQRTYTCAHAALHHRRRHLRPAAAAIVVTTATTLR